MLFRRMICCACSDYKVVNIDEIQNLASSCHSSGIEVHLVADLCLEAVRFPERFASYSGDNSTVLVLCRRRTGQAFFSKLQLPPPEIIGINDDCANERITRLGLNGSQNNESALLPEYQNDWTAWFPLIDKSRCNNCGKCIDFCLFGVYARQNTQVLVTNPEACKTNCPACSRMCPQKAIIFPKHNEEPFNGAPVPNDNTTRNPEESPDEGDLYEKLARRRQKQTDRKLLKDD